MFVGFKCLDGGWNVECIGCCNDNGVKIWIGEYVGVIVIVFCCVMGDYYVFV